MTPQIIFIGGPSGVGKSEAGFLLAQKINGEIVSCDAMQVYREVNIACDKPASIMRHTVPHYLLDAASVAANFNVARYRELAVAAIEDILKRDKVPIVVGGSGMYMSVLLDGIFQSSAKDEALRSRLEEQAKTEGPQFLHEQLSRLDPKAAAKIHTNDVRRIVRALEVATILGKPISEMQKERNGLWGKYAIKIFGLNRERNVLYKKVEDRVDRMFAQGLVDEVKALLKLQLSPTAATLIGIPEVKGYLNGEYDLERARYLLKRNTRHYVKRQLTWFRRDERIQWIDIKEGKIAQDIVKELLNKI